MKRLYDFDTVYNFRDFGGYASGSGGRVAEGKLFRAAHLASVSDRELETIRGLDLGLVVDLRYRPERERQPNRDVGAGRVLEYASVGEDVGPRVAPHEAFVEEELFSAEDARRYMMGSYRARFHDGGFRAVFGETLRHMADTGEAVLIHCAAGKDRTGALAALIHAALGVGREDVMRDFMLTMEAIDIEAMLEPASKAMGARIGRELSPDMIRPMFGVERAYLEAALSEMGDAESYLAGLGVGPAERKALRRHYVVG